jgi:hypothetical protein
MYAWGWQLVWEQARCLQHEGQIKKDQLHAYIRGERGRQGQREREREEREGGREEGRER